MQRPIGERARRTDAGGRPAVARPRALCDSGASMGVTGAARYLLPLSLLCLVACNSGSAGPSPSPTEPVPDTPTPAVATPAPRGVKVVDASEPTGVLQRIPDGPAVGGAPRMPAQYRVTRVDEIRVDTLVT